MTNSIITAVSHFWLEINAHAWRHCPETVQHRLNAAYATLRKELRDAVCQQHDAAFGGGWREGHEAGRLAGWEQRDIEAQRELAHKNDQIQALMAIVEGYELGADAPSEPADRVGADDERSLAVGDARRSLAMFGLMSPRHSVH
jgi:hypothetical protein